MAYSDLLKDPRWQKKRLKILERDEWMCQRCLDTDTTLHVHHERYSGKPWEVDDKYLITLCENCHGYETELKSEDPFKELEGLGLTRFHLVLLVRRVRLRIEIDQANGQSPFFSVADILADIVPHKIAIDLNG